jgi:hypothetical protein
MSKVERHNHRLKLAAKTWGAWKEIVITPEIRNEAPHLKNVMSIYANTRFRVDCFECATQVGGVMHLVVTRHGLLEAPTSSELQRIKIELCGAETEAVEIYPRNVKDVPEKVRHLWVLPTDGYELPFGFSMPTVWGGE